MACLMAAATALSLAACGGSGGATQTASPGVVRLTVTDRYGTAVTGAQVSGPHGQTRTDSQGVALVLTDAPGAAAQVVVARDSFQDQTFTVASLPGQVNAVGVTLERRTLAAGGSLSAGSVLQPVLGSEGQSLSFDIDLAVVGGDALPISGLSRTDFALLPCTPDPASARFDCVRGATASEDVPYAPLTSVPATSTPVPGGAPRPFATVLLLDQSGSITQTDPTAARLFSSKAFLDQLGPQDQVLLAAFAGGPTALISSTPLSVYGPFRDQSQARSYFATLDTLATQVGGDTPLYEAVDTMGQQWLASAALPAALGRAMVVFTDGADTACASQTACGLRRAQSIQAAVQGGVRIFAIGLSGDVDIAALGELANQTGGALLYADNVAQLVPLYGSLGRMMSLSLGTYRLHFTVRADTAGAFRPGQTLLGRVRVTTADSSFDVPFVVGIP